MRCRNHPDRIALGYCSRCGKPLCTTCLVRLSSGNFCETCATPPQRAPGGLRRFPWWLVAVLVLGLLLAARILAR